MVESKLNYKIQILFFVSFMILSTQALEINLLNILTDFKCKTNIRTTISANGSKVYAGTSLRPINYRTSDGTTTLIAYIVDESRFEEIANPNAIIARTKIADELGRNGHEMIVLGIKNCQNDEFDSIGVFLYDIIRPHPNQIFVRIVTMGEQLFSQTYLYCRYPVHQYQENPNIYGGALQVQLNLAFPNMEYRSNRPDPVNIKEVRLYEYSKATRLSYPREVTWPVIVENGKYVPADHISFRKFEYNFVRRYKDKEYHLLILSGKDYNQLICGDLAWFDEIKKITDEMAKKNEILYLMGCFNFDWWDIDVVRQIILKHSATREGEANNVFFVGMGMFDTALQSLNRYDNRYLAATQNEQVLDFIKKYNGGTYEEKTMEICDFNTRNVTTMQIRTINGRYVPRDEYLSYCFPNQHRNAKFAFIVMDTTEMQNPNVFSVAQVNQYVRMLRSNGIIVFIIKANNFKLCDLHIIPEWIQWHRGAVHPDRITILGGGSFDTTFKYVSSVGDVTFAMLNLLKEIRMAFMNIADDKGVIVANIDTPNFAPWRFPMHTINGFYDPVVLSAGDMFRIESGKKILFLIINADEFNNMAREYSTLAATLIARFREKIARHYPVHRWTVYLVGLDNFGEKDLHLFAEFVKIHTNDVRPLQEFVHTFGYGIYQTAYAYKDASPFYTANDMPMADAFIEFFSMIDTFSFLVD